MVGGDWKEMLYAAQTGDVELVRYYLTYKDIDPNYQHPELLTTPLIEASRCGHFTVVECLLENGAKPEIKGILDGVTALQAATIYQHKDIVKRLKKALS